MAHAGPSSSSARKPTKQKQKRDVNKTKRSVLGRQTVELLDKTALDYVRAPLLSCAPPQCVDEVALGPAGRPQGFLGFTNI